MRGGSLLRILRTPAPLFPYCRSRGRLVHGREAPRRGSPRMNLELLSQPDTYVSLFTLTAMEIVLGIDNIVFLSILTAKLPPEDQPKARRLGLSLALLFRLGLLFALSWVM